MTRKHLLELMRQKIAKEFGVTVVEDHVTLRFDVDGHLAQVTMVVTEADDGAPECWMCNEKTTDLHSAEFRMDDNLVSTVELCYDCKYPK